MRRWLICAGLLGLMVLFLWDAPTVSQAVRDGLSLCAGSVIPALFPFFVASSCFTALGLAEDLGRLLAPVLCPLLRCSATGCAAFLLGLLGGYPVGGRAVADLFRRRAVDRAEARRLLAFCNNAGPAFTLTVAGLGCFGSLRAGLLLYAVQVCAAVVTARLQPPAPRSAAAPMPPVRESPAAAFVGAVTAGAAAMGQVCGFTVFFLVLTRLLSARLGLTHPAALGALELTGGVLRLTADRGGFITAAALLSWGGLSVHGQTAAALSGSGLPLGPYLIGKAEQTAIAAALAAAVSFLLF